MLETPASIPPKEVIQPDSWDLTPFEHGIIGGSSYDEHGGHLDFYEVLAKGPGFYFRPISLKSETDWRDIKRVNDRRRGRFLQGTISALDFDPPLANHSQRVWFPPLRRDGTTDNYFIVQVVYSGPNGYEVVTNKHVLKSLRVSDDLNQYLTIDRTMQSSIPNSAILSVKTPSAGS